jgi:hypothetical protein
VDFLRRRDHVFGFGIDETSLETRIRHVILHEFGHALGCVHEHMQPNFPLTWNEQVVLDAHQGIWDEDRARENIFKRYTHDDVQASPFDPESIMLYTICKGWTKEGYVTRMHSNLSEMDNEFISNMYPFLFEPPTSSSFIRVTSSHSSSTTSLSRIQFMQRPRLWKNLYMRRLQQIRRTSMMLARNSPELRRGARQLRPEN